MFIPKQLGVFDDEDFIRSSDTDYVMRRIRQKYLGDSTVTIVLMGKCTHSRRYVDWEIKASLQQGERKPNGLLGIALPQFKNMPSLPDRLALNYSDTSPSYAQCRCAPISARQLRSWIELAYKARTEKPHLITNPNTMMKNNRKCKVCRKTH